MRALRAESREPGRPLGSTRLVGGLQKYSERGQMNVDEVRSLIAFNELAQFDTERASLSSRL